jgi:hypothetical protein
MAQGGNGKYHQEGTSANWNSMYTLSAANQQAVYANYDELFMNLYDSVS